MKNNTLTALNNILFEQLERLNDDELKGDDLTEQLRKSEAINKIAGTIITNANTQLNAVKHMDEYASVYGTNHKAPALLGVDES